MTSDPIVEGSTTLCPPVASGPSSERGGPGSHDREVPFYNPAMGLNRDLSVLLVAAECARKGREIDVADVLAGAGARTLRLAHEIDAPLIVHANDGDPNAIAAIHEGLAANAIPDGRVRAAPNNAHTFLASRRFDIVDIDPFGSPMPFIDSAVRATRHDGLVCLTATDTGALCGTYPKACRRRYGAEPLHRPEWRAEVGLRILAACGVRAAGRLDRAATPVLSIAQGHWMRVVLRVRDGRAPADAAHKMIGRVAEHPDLPLAQWSETGAGPVWQGPLHDPELLEAMLADDRELATPKVGRLLETLLAEATATPFWMHLPHLHSRLGGRLAKREQILRALAEAGASAAPSHMDVQGIRSDADAETWKSVWKSLTTTP